MDLNTFISQFANMFDETDSSEFTADCSYQDLDEWSSITAMSIIALVKTEFGKSISAREIRSCHTIEELYNHIISM